MEQKNLDMLDDAIEDGFNQLKTAKDTDEYCDRVKAVKELIDLEIQDSKIQQEDANRQEELGLRSRELADKRTQEEVENDQNEKKRKTDLLRTGLTVGATVGLSVLTIVENHQGWIFKPDGFLTKLLNHDK